MTSTETCHVRHRFNNQNIRCQLLADHEAVWHEGTTRLGESIKWKRNKETA